VSAVNWPMDEEIVPFRLLDDKSLLKIENDKLRKKKEKKKFQLQTDAQASDDASNTGQLGRRAIRRKRETRTNRSIAAYKKNNNK
jgi:hypothetical protein